MFLWLVRFLVFVGREFTSRHEFISIPYTSVSSANDLISVMEVLILKPYTFTRSTDTETINKYRSYVVVENGLQWWLFRCQLCVIYHSEHFHKPSILIYWYKPRFIELLIFSWPKWYYTTKLENCLPFQ